MSAKYFRYSVFGETWKPIVTFLALFYVVLIVYYQLPTKACCPAKEDGKAAEPYKPFNKTTCSATSINKYQTAMCKVRLTKDGFMKFTTKWKGYHTSLVKVLGMFLGFYVKTMMARWWSQICHLPKIDTLCMTLNGLIHSGAKGEHSALEFKKRILRHCLLSYTLMMITISPSMRKMYGNGDRIVEKGIATWEGAIGRLRKDQGSKLGWMDKWWLPINWCCHLIRDESGSDCHVPKESKELIGKLIKFKHICEEVAEYTHNPLPAICAQAVYLVCWGFLILGAFAYQPCNGNITSSWWILEDVPVYSTLLFGLIFAWLKMADICQSPFDGNLHYDVDLVDELDLNIWSASAAMESIS